MSTKPSRELGNILRKVPSTVVSDIGPAPELPVRPAPVPLCVVTPRLDGEGEKPLQHEVLASVSTDVEVPLQVTVPKRVRKELLVMAASKDCSVRALILRGVRSLGVEVAEDELRDKRRKT